MLLNNLGSKDNLFYVASQKKKYYQKLLQKLRPQNSRPFCVLKELSTISIGK